MSKPHRSWSQINMYLRCAYQFHERYVVGRKVPPGVALLIGDGTHKSVEKNLKSKLQFQEPITLEEALDAGRDRLVERWSEEEVLLSDDEKAQGADRVKAAAIDMTVKLSGLHHGEVAPLIQPAAVETSWTVDIANYDYQLMGITDTETVDGTIIDLKTTARKPSEGAADKMGQLGLYALAKWALTDKKVIPPLTVDWLVKTQTPKAIRQNTTRDLEDFRVLLDTIQTINDAIETGVFPPTNEDNPMCQPKYCGYYPCRYRKGGKIYG